MTKGGHRSAPPRTTAGACIWAFKEGGPVPYEAEFRTLGEAEWRRFAIYYLKRRRATNNLLRQLRHGLAAAVPSANLTRILRQLRKVTSHNDITGQMGEIVASFILEDVSGTFLHGLTWPIQPTAVRRGKDIGGLCTRTWCALIAQVKATRSTAAATIRGRARAAREELRARRLRQEFDMDLEVGASRRAAIGALRQAIRDGQFTSLKHSDIERLVLVDRFIRVGLVVHPKSSGALSYQSHLDELLKDDLDTQGIGPGKPDPRALARLPTIFFDVDVVDFKRSLKRWLALEELKKKDAGSR